MRSTQPVGQFGFTCAFACDIILMFFKLASSELIGTTFALRIANAARTLAIVARKILFFMMIGFLIKHIYEFTMAEAVEQAEAACLFFCFTTFVVTSFHFL